MYPTASNEDIVHQHYARPRLSETILAQLAAAGKNVAALTPEDLAPLDEFHTGGRQATAALAAKLDLKPGQQVLDVGCGLGGAARYLARTYGCAVTGLDLTEEYCQAAEMLTGRMGLDSKVSFRTGNALELPFEDGSFDLVWTQHASMNIADKGRLYAEMRRVLRPGGTFAMYDFLAGPGGLAHFPVPWGRDPSISFLIQPRKLRAELESNGLRITSWNDTSAAGQDWFAAMVGRAGQGLGLHILLGPDFKEMAQNMVRNLAEQCVVLIECIGRG